MNIIGILMDLKGLSLYERFEVLRDLGVNEIVAKHILRCFDDNGNHIDADGKKIILEVKEQY